MSVSIAEAAERSDLTAHTLRNYERDGLMLAGVGRSTSGHRRYTERDLTWIRADHTAPRHGHADP
jgi:DNA-binding transcriptional MerR regulator